MAYTWLCSDCGAANSELADACPLCGHYLDESDDVMPYDEYQASDSTSKYQSVSIAQPTTLSFLD